MRPFKGSQCCVYAGDLLIPIFSLYFIQKLYGLVNTKSDSYHKVYINHTIATYIAQAKDRISISVIKVKNKETDGGLKQKPDFC